MKTSEYMSTYLQSVLASSTVRDLFCTSSELIDLVKHHLFEPNIVCDYLNATCTTYHSFSQPPMTVSGPSTSAESSVSGMAGAGPSGVEHSQLGATGSGTGRPSGEGPTAAGPSGLTTAVGASTQTSLASQPGPSSASEPEDTGAAAAVAAVRDNSQTDAGLNDENSEIRRRRLERFSSSLSQESSDKDKND